jgi:hypothetical protein
MSIPSEILRISQQINEELVIIEQVATDGLNLTRSYLSQFPDNAVLLQFFGAFSNMLVFVNVYKRRVQTTLEQLAQENLSSDIIQSMGEDLGTILGQVIEAKMNVNTLKKRLED